jgi:hypothetical protein
MSIRWASGARSQQAQWGTPRIEPWSAAVQQLDIHSYREDESQLCGASSPKRTIAASSPIPAALVAACTRSTNTECWCVDWCDKV